MLVRRALPGEIVDAAIVARKRDYAVARTVAVVAPSPRRVSPPCRVYGVCGGCTLQHADYPCQLAMKASALADTLVRIAKVGTGPPPIHASDPLRYRHRAQFKADASGLGFHAEGTHRVVPVLECPLVVDGINVLFAACRDAAALGGAAGIAFRDRAWGSPGRAFRLGGFDYGVSPGTFFQANWKVKRELVGRIGALIGEVPTGRVLDLYAGAGNFTLPLSAGAAEVVAVEESADALRDLKRNIAVNRIGNVKAVRSRIERFRPSGRYDAVVADPPRTGLSERAVGLLRESRARRVFYVSCNPATLARDLSRLSGVYGIGGIEAYDFFPQTHHVETLVVLDRLQ